MHLVFIILAWILVILATTALLAVGATLLGLVFRLTRAGDPLSNIPPSSSFSRAGYTIFITSNRYLIRALAATLLFCPTFNPYFPQSLENLSLTDFMFKFGVIWDAQHPMGPYLASFTLLKGLTIGPDYLVHVGGAPLIMTTIAAWLSAMAIRFLPALPNLVIAAILYFGGAALHNAAMADYGRVTLDPFILAFLLKTSAIALLIASITTLLRLLKTTLNPPPEPQPLCPPIPPLP